MNSADEFGSLSIWRELDGRLPWYLAVACNRMPAKYLISLRIPCEVNLQQADETELWREHAMLTEDSLEAKEAIRRGEERLSSLPKAETSLLDLSVELSKRMLRHCSFCRWNCRVDRAAGLRHGACQLESDSRVSCYFHHTGEELVFRGTRGSGTVFFTSCNMRCAYCQNGDISHDKENGLQVNPQHVAAMAWQLRMEGCHNINWVGGEPTIHLHTILEAFKRLAGEKPSAEDLNYVQNLQSDGFHAYSWEKVDAHFEGEFNAPMLWNSNFYMSPEALKLLRPLIDIWLPDFKFGDNKCALSLARTPWYFETVSRNHKLVYDWGEDVVIRHLVLPNHVECCTKPVLEWIAENMPEALVNIMDQYHPDYSCDPSSPQYDERYAGMARRLFQHEVLESYDYAAALGLHFEEVTYEKNATGLRL